MSHFFIFPEPTTYISYWAWLAWNAVQDYSSVKGKAEESSVVLLILKCENRLEIRDKCSVI